MSGGVRRARETGVASPATAEPEGPMSVARTTSWFANHDIALAQASAAASGRPLFVDFVAREHAGGVPLLAATYADDAVDALLAREFVCVRYDTARAGDGLWRLTGSLALLWAPDVAVMTHRLRQVRRLAGYLPPPRFAAQLRTALALWHLHEARYAQALDHLAVVADAEGAGDAAPEALYWAGVAAYRAGGPSALRVWWTRLTERHPASDWAMRADGLHSAVPPARTRRPAAAAAGRLRRA
jgi:hypothetical protein